MNYYHKKALLDLADSMERGWKKVPHMNKTSFYEDGDDPVAPKNCCARGHAGLGKYNHAGCGSIEEFPILEKQSVQNPEAPEWYPEGAYSLRDAIDDLVRYHNWTTPMVVKWIRSHVV